MANFAVDRQAPLMPSLGLMRIQAKLFLLLVVIAVLPLAALSWRSQVATQRLGMAIADQGRVAVSSQAEEQLRQAVYLGNTILFQEQRLIELTLKLQATEVERLLQRQGSGNSEPVYFSSDFDDPSQWPPGTAPSQEHRQRVEDGTAQPLDVSLDHQSFFIPQGVDRSDIASSLLRLSPLTTAYQDLEEENEALIFWQYTTLEDGTHSVFPGHGGYPDTYDPRERAWYRLAKAANRLIWTPPLIDATTGQLLLTAALPVFEDSGEFAGVTAIDVQILSVLTG